MTTFQKEVTYIIIFPTVFWLMAVSCLQFIRTKPWHYPYLFFISHVVHIVHQRIIPRLFFQGSVYSTSKSSLDYLFLLSRVCVCAKSFHSCPTLCDHMDCSLLGSSLHGILQAGLWSGLPFPYPGDLPDTGIEPISCTGRQVLYHQHHLGSPLEHQILFQTGNLINTVFFCKRAQLQ